MRFFRPKVRLKFSAYFQEAQIKKTYLQDILESQLNPLEEENPELGAI